MAFTRSEETALIQALYSAASQTGNGAWRVFLELLANTTHADIAGVIVQAGDQRTVSVSAENGAGTLSALTGASDPSGLNRLRNGRVYAQEDLPGTLPESGAKIRIARAQVRDGFAWLLIYRNREDFRALDSTLLSFLMPHLGTATENWIELGRIRLDIELKQRLTDGLGCGWVAFDHTGKIVDRDAYAKHQSIAPEPELVRRIVETQTPSAVILGETHDLLLVPYSADITPKQNAIACVGLIRDTQPGESPDPQHIAETLDIAHSEARLAASLAQGLTLSESAEALGLTIETARNYSKRIFAQTGLKGQPDLVRRVLNGVARLL